MFLLSLLTLLVAGPLHARSPEQITIDWSGFQREVSARKIAGHKIEIALIGGAKFKTKLISASDRAIVVHATSATAQWAARPKEADIPRDQIRSVRVDGKLGHRGLIGGLAGLGAGAAIAAAVVSGSSCDEIGCLVLIAPAIAIPAAGAVAGYFVGRASAPPGPEFVLTP